MQKLHDVVLIAGDGIGPEVMRATRRVLEAAGAPLRYTEAAAGESAIAQGHKDVLPKETLAAIREHHLALKGPCSTPIGSGFRSVNVALRKSLNLYAAVRPVRNMPGIKTRYDGVDLVIIRENTEGLYSGVENVITDDVVASMKVATRTACKRIAQFAFRYAVHRKRKKVTTFHKANIMKLTDGMFLEEARKVHDAEFASVAYDEMIIDAALMRIVQDPTKFDMLLCENLYGDLVSDLCAGLVGGLGVTPGANIGDTDAVFEAVHGSAPDIAGKGIANPLALLMSAAMLLNHIADTRGDEKCRSVAQAIRGAYDRALEAGDRTGDLGGKLGTEAFADAIIKRLGTQ
ncbi:MAG TPA: isocitrate/isopropylmalate dehydrogenase family protein [Polyangiales bacterium]|nr:isocitrate/isopropylmalate dehydrogenase family protein [Polyangiales bacterium]